MLFKLLVAGEWFFFIATSLLLAILSLVVVQMKREQFVRLFSFSGSKYKQLPEIKVQLLKVAAALPRVRVNSIISSVIAIISLTFIWFLLYKKLITRPINAETILLGIAAIVPVPIVIALIEYCVNKMNKRADELIAKGE